jgi:hypothetical protein
LTGEESAGFQSCFGNSDTIGGNQGRAGADQALKAVTVPELGPAFIGWFKNMPIGGFRAFESLL